MCWGVLGDAALGLAQSFAIRHGRLRPSEQGSGQEVELEKERRDRLRALGSAD